MPQLKSAVYALTFALAIQAGARAQDAFTQQVVPFLQNYCVDCHNATTKEGELDLTRYTSAAALGEHFRQWQQVLAFLRKGEMPPEGAEQPSTALRAEMLATLDSLMAAEAQKLAGDPGMVLPRRLTAAEYNYTIRDLAGVDIRPADSFPIDPASGEGFNNTGEALVMSPELFKRYYAAGQHVAEHIVLTPSGLRFAPYPVVTFADQAKYHEQAILRFYEEHDVVYEAYLSAAWTFRYRPEAHRGVSIEEWAVENKLSPKYLRHLWSVLNDEPADDKFYLGWIRRQWNDLPAAEGSEAGVPVAITRQISALADNIRRTSALLCTKEAPAIVSNAGNGPVQHIDRRKQTAAERDTFDESFITDSRRFHVEFQNLPDQSAIAIHLQAGNLSDGEKPEFVVLKDLSFSTRYPNEYRPDNPSTVWPLRDILAEHAPDQLQRLNAGVHPLGHAIDPNSVALSTSEPLVISVPSKAFPDRRDIRFYVDAKLDGEDSEQGIVRFALSDGATLANGAALAEGATLSDRPATFDGSASLLVDPQSQAAKQLRDSCEALCGVFPNRFFYVDETRGLSAGFHLIEGFFRDDLPLCKLVLGDDQQRELDRLWDEMYFGTGMMEKMLRGFVFFERSERNFLKHPDFDPFKEEDPLLTSDETLNRFEQVYLVQSGVDPAAADLADHPIHLFFEEIRQGLRRRKDQLAEAKPIYLRQLLDLAERAWRRPLTEEELASMQRFFESASRQPEIGVEQAVRGVLTSILVSPHFCCRIDVPPAGDSVQALSDIALASRLSYFLWSSMPDAELMALAKAGKLNDETTLRQQTRRMLNDPKVSAFALEFFGQWLRYRDFLSQESVDRGVFPSFNDELKQAMFEEPTRLATYLIQNNLPVTDLLYGDTTFVNQPLAAHYGWPYQAGGPLWQKVDGIQQHGRGGVLGMAVFLTTYSQPQRTSPVKRGFWVVHKILGEHIPAPPNNVAVLPAKETETEGKTIRQLLAQHTEAESCARCHRRFDPIGLAMEGFDPIGKRRDKDLAGRPVDNVVQLPAGGEARGVPEFLKHLQSERNGEFTRTLSHKFVGYALGRSIELSDNELLERLQMELQRDDYRFATLFETVVCSPQFRNQRCRDFSVARFKPVSQRPQKD